MLRSLRIFFFVMMVGLLTSCGTMITPKYTYIPPDNKADRVCASHCSTGKNYCNNLCRFKLESCRTRAYRLALNKFEMYKRQVESRGGQVKKTVRDFDKGYTCKVTCNCIVSFNTCYSACGGEVLEHYM
jgi:hypothetical protein